MAALVTASSVHNHVYVCVKYVCAHILTSACVIVETEKKQFGTKSSSKSRRETITFSVSYGSVNISRNQPMSMQCPPNVSGVFVRVFSSVNVTRQTERGGIGKWGV